MTPADELALAKRLHGVWADLNEEDGWLALARLIGPALEVPYMQVIPQIQTGVCPHTDVAVCPLDAWQAHVAAIKAVKGE